MDKNLSGEDNDGIAWDTEDELEIQEIPDTTFSSCTNLRNVGQHTVCCHEEASSSSVPCQSKFIQQFIVMGFPEESIAKAIEQNGENEDLVLDALLTFKNSADQCYLQDENSSLSEKEQTLLFLANMGYPAEEASIAMERCQKAYLAELIDFMCAAQMAREEDAYLPEDVKDKNLSGEDNDGIAWDTEDELEIQEIPDTTFSSCTNLRNVGQHTVCCHEEASSSSVPCQSKFIQQFIVMGFPEESIAKAIEQNGENEDLVLDALLTFKALEDSPEEQPSTNLQLEPCISSDDSSSQYDENLLDDIYDSLSEKEQTLLFLANMGYPAEEASIAMERCQKAYLAELIDFMCAAQMAREEDAYLPEDVKPKLNSGGYKKRKMYNELCIRKKQRALFDEETIALPNPMIGFGVPTESVPGMVQRTLPEQAIGPPYFYYENVALAPKVEGRFPLLPLPPLTIHEAFPLAKKWWPSWDTRIKLNCLQTSIGSARLADRIRKAMEAMENFDGEPPLRVQKYVLHECRKWNLLWVGRNKVAPLEPDEVEMLLGFPRNHTRGGGISRTEIQVAW
ncbi:hypothetical protein K7X08_031485 [Anisodus acutangulus]|uniref:Uncharacterized protein n=1 Tax=Anisodus acutangulus TaxID=402998 RepID=A0A9Q1MPS1_9SOLA|nr:hypothetical protein K7X08_031485 [Anisodus acutangulus]